MEKMFTIAKIRASRDESNLNIGAVVFHRQALGSRAFFDNHATNAEA